MDMIQDLENRIDTLEEEIEELRDLLRESEQQRHCMIAIQEIKEQYRDEAENLAYEAYPEGSIEFVEDEGDHLRVGVFINSADYSAGRDVCRYSYSELLESIHGKLSKS